MFGEGQPMRIDRIKAATDDIVAAALVGGGWEAALAGFAEAAGAHGAVIMRNRPDRLVSVITSEEIAEPVADFAAGRAPPSSRYARVRPGRAIGFRVDHDDYSDAELARDPYYQEFLRPRGFFWHANALLLSAGGETVELGLKRRLRAGPYQRDDAALLDAVLPDLRGAAALASRTLEAEARGAAAMLTRRGAPVYRFDRKGNVLAGETTGEAAAAAPVRVVGRRLAASDPAAQSAVDRAIAAALGYPAVAGLAGLTDADGRRAVLQVLPLAGRAREVFIATAAVGVVIDLGGPPLRLRLEPAAVAHAFGLTDREADIACLLAEGLALTEIAARLAIEVATARVHLRSVFEKTGARRQAELVAMLARLMT
jgi:DNA-binding CsgD family transcriptional regulator